MKVKCLDDRIDINKVREEIKPILLVGEELPVKGEVYEVEREVHFSHTDKDDDKVGYVLRGFDFSAYGIDVAFSSKRFEIVEGDGYENRFIMGDIYKVKEITMVIDVPKVLKDFNYKK